MQDYYEPKVGDMAGDFRLPSTRGKEVTLKQFRGSDVILYFFSRDDGQASAFSHRESDFNKAHAAILGISIDSPASQEKFSKDEQLTFPLLADQTADVAKMYGVWKEKNMSGRRVWGVARRTFWIGADGRIKKIWKKADTANHAEEVLAAMRTR
jgi:peroxiredoxin Q/BCP